MSSLIHCLSLALTFCVAHSFELNHTAPQSDMQRGILLQLFAGTQIKQPTFVCGLPNRDSRLLGGEYSGTHEFPWVTDVITQENMAGAGSLINDRYVITAGSLMRGMTPYDVKVTLGMHDRCTDDKSSIRMSVDDIRVHENYDLRTRANDVALLKLSGPVVYQKNMLPICMPTPGSTYLGQVATLVTWGQDEEEVEVGEGGEVEVTPISAKRRKEGVKPRRSVDVVDAAVTLRKQGDKRKTPQRQEVVGEQIEPPVDVVDAAATLRKQGDKRKTPQRQEVVGEQIEPPVDVIDNACRQRKVGLPVLERDQCEVAFGKTYVSRDKGCVGIVNVPSMVCETDAGGPVMYRNRLGIYELIGVLAASNDCLRSRGPSLFTKINDFTRWITYHTRDATYF